MEEFKYGLLMCEWHTKCLVKFSIMQSAPEVLSGIFSAEHTEESHAEKSWRLHSLLMRVISLCILRLNFRDSDRHSSFPAYRRQA